jgi:hypothetical protein
VAKWFRHEVEAKRIIVIPVLRPGRVSSPASGEQIPAAARVALMSGSAVPAGLQSLPAQIKIVEMLLRSLKYLPADSRAAFLSLISPSALIAATLANSAQCSFGNRLI